MNLPESNRPGDPPIGPFRAAWWCPGRHPQTLWGRLVRREPRVEYNRARWTTPDGDFLDLDFVDGPLGSPQVLVLHGLEGSAERKYVRGLLRRARERGWRGVALNFRSCSGAMNRGGRLYHSGETADLNWVVSELAKREPGAPILPVGFSLGANVLLKWLGEEGERVPDDVRAAVAISTPFDLAAAASKMSHGPGRLYSRYFLRTLKAKALRKAAEHPDRLDAAAIRAARTWREYDDAATAPLHGFRDAEDYWARSSSLFHLQGIRRPVLLISSGDDPFVPAWTLTEVEREAQRSDWLNTEFSDRDGHVGFVGGRVPWTARYWAERRALAFLARFVPTLRPARDDEPGWLRNALGEGREA